MEARYAAQTERRAANTAMAQASASAATPAEWASSASPTFLSPTAEMEKSDVDDDENRDVDIPYTQATTFDPDDFGELEGPSNEPIRPGDVIEYYCPIFVSGDKPVVTKVATE